MPQRLAVCCSHGGFGTRGAERFLAGRLGLHRPLQGEAKLKQRAVCSRFCQGEACGNSPGYGPVAVSKSCCKMLWTERKIYVQSTNYLNLVHDPKTELTWNTGCFLLTKESIQLHIYSLYRYLRNILQFAINLQLRCSWNQHPRLWAQAFPWWQRPSLAVWSHLILKIFLSGKRLL